jgi:hypothetical protein
VAHPQAADVAEVVVVILQQLKGGLGGRLPPLAPPAAPRRIRQVSRLQRQALQVAPAGGVRVLRGAVVAAACGGEAVSVPRQQVHPSLRWAPSGVRQQGQQPSSADAAGLGCCAVRSAPPARFSKAV